MRNKDHAGRPVEPITQSQEATLAILESRVGIPIPRWPTTAKGASYMIDSYRQMQRLGVRR